MRLLVVSLSSPDPICRRLDEGGFEVAALFPWSVDLGDFGGLTRATPGQEPYQLTTAPVFPTRPYVYSRWLWGLDSTIRSTDPDVLLYVGEPSELAAGQVATQLRRACPEARLGMYVFENIERCWRGKLRWLRGIAERTVLSTIDFAACATEGARQRLVSLGLPRKRARVIYPEVDPELFRPGQAEAVRESLGTGDGILVGYAGRMVWEKGLDVLIEAMSMLPDRYTLLLLGSGRYLQELKEQWRTLGLEERIRHVPHVPQEQVPEYLQAMDMFVLPSRSIEVWQEQYGRVLPQAMLCATPVIGSDSGAIPEVVGEAGLIFPENQPQQLASCIRRLGENPQERDDLARAGRQRALENFVNTYRTRLADWITEAASMPLRSPEK